MQKAFLTRHFQRWLRKTGLTEKALCEAIAEMQQGLVDANLGGGVVKKRVPIEGRGKSGGVRTLVATNKADRWFFVFGFAKNVRANISDAELAALHALAADLLHLTQQQLNEAVEDGSLQRICHGQ